MKFNLLFFTILMISKSFLFGQTWTAGTNLVQTAGSVGIGNIIHDPYINLDIYAEEDPKLRLLTKDRGSLELGIAGCNTCHSIGINPGDAVLRAYNKGKNLIITNNGAVNMGSILFRNGAGATEKTRMEISASGQVLIGLNSSSCALPDGGLLGVNGTIYATQVKVKSLVSGCFPDFVFEKDYKLRSIKEVESFIIQNKHLPEVPSAQEMEKQDIDIAEMDALLLKKIEELTLYIIELEKKVEKLNHSINK